MNLYRVYAVKNPEGKFYLGLSDDLEHRIAQHNAGESRWTRGKGPWELVWNSPPMSLSQARKLENLLKRQKAGAGFYRITRIDRRRLS